MKKLVIALALLVTLPSIGAAAVIVVPPVPEQVVEGHTVFTVIEARVETNVTEERFGAAVAVLVREVEVQKEAFRFPGVLWFNDQYLVKPESSFKEEVEYRHPCQGAVLATNAGDSTLVDTDPTTGFKFVNATGLTPKVAYVESYHITDPNDHGWDVDKWDLTAADSSDDQWLWSVAILNNQLTYSQADDGDSDCNPYKDNPKGGPIVAPFVDFPCEDAQFEDKGDCSRVANGGVGKGYKDPGDHGYGYPCGLKDSQFEGGSSALEYNCPNVAYNALLFFHLEDLDIAGANKDHTTGSADWSSDVAGCQYDSGAFPEDEGPWPCPAADDDNEGNSHPYNPNLPYPLLTYDGKDNHGGSCDVAPGERQGADYQDGTSNCHATRNIEVMFGYGSLPILRNYVVEDYEGSTAPYHCHRAGTQADPCNQKDALGPAYPGSAGGYP